MQSTTQASNRPTKAIAPLKNLAPTTFICCMLCFQWSLRPKVFLPNDHRSEPRRLPTSTPTCNAPPRPSKSRDTSVERRGRRWAVTVTGRSNEECDRMLTRPCRKVDLNHMKVENTKESSLPGEHVPRPGKCQGVRE